MDQRGIATITVLEIIGAFLAIFVGVYFGLVRQYVVAPAQTPTPPPGCFYQQVQCITTPCDPVLVCPSETPIEEVPASWKTYTNTQYGFEVKYPGDWVTDQFGQPHTKESGDVPSSPEGVMGDPGFHKEYDARLSSGFLPRESAGISLVEYANSRYCTKDIKSTFIDNYQAVVCSGSLNETGVLWSYHTAYIEKDGLIYGIGLDIRPTLSGSAQKSYRDLLVQILFTFKFTK